MKKSETEQTGRTMHRTAGILMPVFSLPGRYGTGTLGKEAYAFVEFLAKAGQSYWQVLPVGPTGYGDSPYQSFSTFAGNPYFIDLETLIEEGLLTREECDGVDFGTEEDCISYEKLYFGRFPLLRKAYERFAARISAVTEEGADASAAPTEMSEDDKEAAAYHAFLAHAAHWLPAYARFMHEKSGYPEGFYSFTQYEFDKQWMRLRTYANARGVAIIGDIPIYVSSDSVDFTEHPELFQLDDKGHPRQIAGCPPDSFAAGGQLWGNPIYDWDYHKKSGYRWWIERMRRCFELFDVVRVDHFRGFDEYYAVPVGAKDAVHGHWEKGPGIALFHALKEALGEKQIIAEDLGFVTDSVRQLVQDSGYPGMKLLEFGFDSREVGDYRPCTWPENSVCYTGTHDNQTLAAWLTEISPVDLDFAARYYAAWEKGEGAETDVRPRTEEEVKQDPSAAEAFRQSDYVDALIRMTLSSRSATAIIPMQDYLGLGAEARINTPSTLGRNWSFRFKEGSFTDETAARIRQRTEESRRIRE